MAEYAGNRWYKCDLHLHTMASRCYLEKENTRLRRENQELAAQNKVLRELVLEGLKGNLPTPPEMQGEIT